MKATWPVASVLCFNAASLDHWGGPMPQPPRTFRVFVSSTFSDLKAERNALQRHVWPALRDLCVRYGTRFQAIDLRWGISEEAARDQRTMAICLEELRRCQQVSPRPNFVLLLGDRYGWRPLPYRIPAREFETLLEAVPPGERSRLVWSGTRDGPGRGWYRRDDNAIPAQYVLLPRIGSYEDYAAWSVVEHDLRAIFLRAFATGGLPDALRWKYDASATEQEIWAGALAGEASSDHVFGFFRSIQGLPFDETARDFVDLIPAESGAAASPDLDARDRLAALKAALRQRLPAANIHPEYVAAWMSGHAEGSGTPSTNHLEQLCADVFASLAGVILGEIASLQQEDPVEQEITSHQRFGAGRARVVEGRSGALDAIAEYVASEDVEPLLIHGPSGSGKSAVMARAAAEARNARENALVITRFIGATPESSDARSLLRGLCLQLARSYGGHAAAVPSDFSGLSRDFLAHLARAASERPAVLILDALDQLADTDHARSLFWLPTTLPPHVRLVVSAISDPDSSAGDCYRALASRLPQKNQMALPSLAPESSAAALKTWFNEIGRTLHPDQDAKVLDAFSSSGLPLHLRLLFEEARHWRSFDEVASVAKDISGSVANLFERLAAPERHGALIVDRGLGYLAAAKNGLAEDELLDVLSADNEIFRLYAASAHHELTERRLPVVVWSRLAFDLRPYLVERAADGAVLLGFFHRQFSEAVETNFLGGAAGTERHQTLATYFAHQPLDVAAEAGSTFDQPLGPGIAEIVPNLVQGVALPAARPASRSNLRKLSEQPFQQTVGRQWDELYATLTDFLFLERKAMTGAVGGEDGSRDATSSTYAGIFAVQDDFRRALHAARDTAGDARRPHRFSEDGMAQVSLLSELLNREAHVLARYPTLLPSHVHTIIQVEKSQAEGADPLLSRACEALGDRVWLRVTNRPRVPSSSLRRTLDHGASVSTIAWTPDGNRVASASHDGLIKYWDAETGGLIRELHLEPSAVLAWSPDVAMFAVGGKDGSVGIGQTDAPSRHLERDGHTGSVTALAWSPNATMVASAGEDRSIRLRDLATGETTAILQGHASTIGTLAWSPVGMRLASASFDGTIRVWQAPHGEAVAVLRQPKLAERGGNAESNSVLAKIAEQVFGEGSEAADAAFQNGIAEPAFSVAWNPDGSRIAAAGMQAVRIWHLESAPFVVAEWPLASARALAWSPDGATLAAASVGGERTSVGLWDVASKSEIGRMEGHQSPSTMLAWHSAGRWLASAGLDGKIHLFDTAQAGAEPLRGHSDIVQRVCWNPDGALYASMSTFDAAVLIWDGASSELKHRLPSGQLPVCCWSPEGGSFAIASGANGAINVLDRVGPARVLAKHNAPVLALAWSHGSSPLLASGSGDPDNATVRVWDPVTRLPQPILEGHTAGITALAWSIDRVLASGANDNTVRLWDLAMGSATHVLEGHTGPITALAWSADGRVLASASQDHTIRLWNVADARQSTVLRGHSGYVLSVAWSPDGRLIASGAGDNLLRIWDVDTGESIADAYFFSPVLAIQFSDDGRILHVADSGVVTGNCPRGYVCVLEQPFTRAGRERVQ